MDEKNMYWEKDLKDLESQDLKKDCKMDSEKDLRDQDLENQILENQTWLGKQRTFGTTFSSTYAGLLERLIFVGWLALAVLHTYYFRDDSDWRNNPDCWLRQERTLHLYKLNATVTSTYGDLWEVLDKVAWIAVLIWIFFFKKDQEPEVHHDSWFRRERTFNATFTSTYGNLLERLIVSGIVVNCVWFTYFTEEGKPDGQDTWFTKERTLHLDIFDTTLISTYRDLFQVLYMGAWAALLFWIARKNRKTQKPKKHTSWFRRDRTLHLRGLNATFTTTYHNLLLQVTAVSVMLFVYFQEV